MAIKKSNLFSSLYASYDELCGNMDASQYRDFVLFMLFIKRIGDKYGNSADKINTQIIQPLIDANSRLARSVFPDFNDHNKLCEGWAMVERLRTLVGVLEKPELTSRTPR